MSQAEKKREIKLPVPVSEEGLSPLFDSHAHYTDWKFPEATESLGGTEALISHLFESGIVGGIVNVSTNTENAKNVIAQSAGFKHMYAAVGIHPTDVELIPKEIDEQLAELEEMLLHRTENKIVALGEIGLDYYWRTDNKPRQKVFFEAQLGLAEKYDIPVIIHDREAHGDIFEEILKHPDVRGVFHCYSGSAEMARELVRRGWYISFTGNVTFDNSKKAREAASAVPLDRLLVETDCPYLAPVPCRGKTNHSGLVTFTAATLAQLHGVSTDELIRLTFDNAVRLFAIDDMA